MTAPIFDLSPNQIAEIRGFMLSGAQDSADRAKAEEYARTISMILGERDNLAKGVDAWRDAFDRYGAEVKRIMAPAERSPLLSIQSTERPKRLTLDEIMAREG